MSKRINRKVRIYIRFNILKRNLVNNMTIFIIYRFYSFWLIHVTNEYSECCANSNREHGNRHIIKQTGCGQII